MVSITSKLESHRIARAHAKITLNKQAFEAIIQNTVQKGDVLAVSRLAGILAAKKTHELIPLCHPLSLSHVKIELKPVLKSRTIEILTTCEVTGRTGVEMEALTAASIAALTIYDMVKALDKTMIISEIWLIEKIGGKSGVYKRSSAAIKK